MTPVKWSSKYTVDIEIIDSQHKELFQLVNKLEDAVKSDRLILVVYDSLIKLIDYALIHFKTEENYFKEYNYPDLDYHTKEHVKFTKDVMEYRKKFEKGDLSVAGELLEYLYIWVESHIKIIDKQYTPFFSGVGLS